MKRKSCPYCDKDMFLSFENSSGWCCMDCGVFIRNGKVEWVRGKQNKPWGELPEGVLVMPDRKEL